jgi:hypothetical protein
MRKNKDATVDITGHMGGDPELHSLPAREQISAHYDPILGVVERTVTRPELNFITYSIAINGRGCDGEPFTRWIRCIDYDGCGFYGRRGNLVTVSGLFRERSYRKGDAIYTRRSFVVTRFELLSKRN